jgi:hypothetical protein
VWCNVVFQRAVCLVEFQRTVSRVVLLPPVAWRAWVYRQQVTWLEVAKEVPDQNQACRWPTA